MKTNKTFAYGFLTVIIALALLFPFTSCKEPEAEVTPPENHAPTTEGAPAVSGSGITTVTAGSAYEISLATFKSATTITLTAPEYTDADGDTVTYTWAQVGNSPSDVNVSSTDQTARTATFSNITKAGTYTFQLTVTDGEDPVTQTVTLKVEPYTATKDVEVSFPTYVSGQTTGQSTLNLVPKFTPDGVWGEFSDSDITYIVTDNLDNTYDSGTGFVITTGDGPYSYDTYTFTQVFKAGTTEIGRQVIKVNVTGSFRALQDANGNVLDPQAIPSIPLHLEKTVSEIR